MSSNCAPEAAAAVELASLRSLPLPCVCSLALPCASRACDAMQWHGIRAATGPAEPCSLRRAAA
eukprot:4458320-Pleurochrysis_carterae.AAC.2